MTVMLVHTENFDQTQQSVVPYLVSTARGLAVAFSLPEHGVPGSIPGGVRDFHLPRDDWVFVLSSSFHHHPGKWRNWTEQRLLREGIEGINQKEINELFGLKAIPIITLVLLFHLQTVLILRKFLIKNLLKPQAWRKLTFEMGSRHWNIVGPSALIYKEATLKNKKDSVIS
ncbi:uncharacterized protein LOC126149144 [Schistocerca cancellata]|uniref:uncharacterized protein LOC126149144 n=1 Tax=Schistocerca cancellata TaxID=274614 RepID=UPI0021191E59|nr:uncharacterized protein LOC126149144 [Schistocerca cancellata]